MYLTESFFPTTGRSTAFDASVVYHEYTHGLVGRTIVDAGGFLVVAYNLELAGGRFHTDAWFALAWGGFPVLTGYFVEAQVLRVEAVLAAAFATLLSLAQRLLSTPVRRIRRGGADVDDETRAALLAAPEAALRALWPATAVLAAALVVVRVT